MKTLKRTLVSAMLLTALAAQAHSSHTGGIHTPANPAIDAAFDIVHTRIAKQGNYAVFHIAVAGKAGQSRPSKVGTLAGSTAFSYVWPTTIDPAAVGFDHNAGILAFAVTAHPDFDDTPLYDENGDGNLNNDGDLWHSHWVVLKPDDACGKGKLKVVDIAPGAKPALPRTWPGLPILIDSPGYSPVFNDSTLEVRVPFADLGGRADLGFDGVTAALRVNTSVHSPLLCVADLFKVASGALTLPGKLGQ